MQRRIRHRWFPGVLLAGLIGFLLIGTATAAEFVDGGDTYRLESSQVIEDDLYIGGNEIYIDGTVQGDLIAAGGYIEINGVVTGDVIAAGGSIVINGEVQDDVRAAGSGIDIVGTVGDDVIVAGGGGPAGNFPFQIDGRTIEQGVRIADSARIGGDAAIAGGEGDVNGVIGGKLWGGMGMLRLAAQVGGEANVAAETITVSPDSRIGGILFYTSPEEISVPDGVAERVVYEQSETRPDPSPVSKIGGWVIRTALVLLGFALAGWLLLRFAPRTLTRPASAIAARPGRAALYGLLLAIGFIFLPLISALLVFLMVLFWGWFPGIVMFLFLFGTLALLWFLSPLVTGLWLGKQISTSMGRGDGLLAALLIGALLIAFIGGIPFIGWIAYLVSFIFALGGLATMGRADYDDTLMGATA